MSYKMIDEHFGAISSHSAICQLPSDSGRVRPIWQMVWASTSICQDMVCKRKDIFFPILCAPGRVPPGDALECIWHRHDTEGIREESSEMLRLDFNNLVILRMDKLHFTC